MNYVKDLKVKDNVNNNTFIPVLESKRKTGFIGFVITLNSILNLYNRYIDNLQYIRTYRLSQDHIEIFFGTIRSHGGHNNNPTAKQFRAAYRKIVIRTNDVQSFNTGNCIPLEHIDILHYSSSDPIKVINYSTGYDKILMRIISQMLILLYMITVILLDRTLLNSVNFLKKLLFIFLVLWYINEALLLNVKFVYHHYFPTIKKTF